MTSASIFFLIQNLGSIYSKQTLMMLTLLITLKCAVSARRIFDKNETMGCPLLKPSAEIKSKDIPFDDVTQDPKRYSTDRLSSEPAPASGSFEMKSPPLPKPPISLPTQRKLHIQLHIPIYVALRSYDSTQNNYLSFEEGDEMELIEELNSSQLRVNHLRTDHSGIVSRDSVKLDEDTPLRLKINDRGIASQCIMHYNVPGVYFIRRANRRSKEFVLSIDQMNEERNTLQWHYLIRIEPSNRCFYFADEVNLKNIYFSSFRELVADQRVRAAIPLTSVLPYTIEFEGGLWNIPLNELTIGDRIGAGEFGEVFRGVRRKDNTVKPVALKKIRIHGVSDVVTREIEAMRALTNLYIVSLYGISRNNSSNELFIVTELMENGDLKSWLKRLPKLPDHATILRFSRQITHGMTYLEQHNYAHRDLACRNILVGPNANIVKIADFGLSMIVNDRDAERRQQVQSQKIPVRWTAPEVLSDPATYSIKSDVWSFGILSIEIWLKGENPYGSMLPQLIVEDVIGGYVHEQPPNCPEKYYQSVIEPCLQYNPNERPKFNSLRQLFEQWKF